MAKVKSQLCNEETWQPTSPVFKGQKNQIRQIKSYWHYDLPISRYTLAPWPCLILYEAVLSLHHRFVSLWQTCDDLQPLDIADLGAMPKGLSANPSIG